MRLKKKGKFSSNILRQLCFEHFPQATCTSNRQNNSIFPANYFSTASKNLIMPKSIKLFFWEITLNKTVQNLQTQIFFFFQNFQKLREACQPPAALSATGSKSKFFLSADKRVNQNSDWRHRDKSPALKPTQLPQLKISRKSSPFHQLAH